MAGDGPRGRTGFGCAATAGEGVVVFLWLLEKARVAPWRAAETAGLAVALPVGVGDKVDEGTTFTPRAWVWFALFGEGGGCIGREEGGRETR